MVKLLENTFRAVNIGLVNELALMCDRLGLSVWEVVDAAATKPFGFMPFYPGPGLGGHCIPIDPFYLSWKVKEVGFEARFIELAGHVNGAMPHHVVDKVDRRAEHAQQGRARLERCSCSAIAYKRDIDDMRESPALDVMAVLQAEGREDQLPRPVRRDARGTRLAGRRRSEIRGAHASGARTRRLRRHRHGPQGVRLQDDRRAREADRRFAQRDQGRARARVQAGSAGGEVGPGSAGTS